MEQRAAQTPWVRTLLDSRWRARWHANPLISVRMQRSRVDCSPAVLTTSENEPTSWFVHGPQTVNHWCLEGTRLLSLENRAALLCEGVERLHAVFTHEASLVRLQFSFETADQG